MFKHIHAHTNADGGGKKRESELGGLVALNSMPMYEKRHMYVVTKLGKTVTRVKATLKTNTSWWDLRGGGETNDLYVHIKSHRNTEDSLTTL